MTGWNMPPGVNESDIPGNRPEDMIEPVLVPDRAIGYLKHDVLDILEQWSAGKIGVGIAYERIITRASEDLPDREG